MARILITGSSDGIGVVAARRLIKQGHSVILHARNESRAEDAKRQCPGAEAVLIGDLSSIKATKKLAEEANNKYGSLDAVVHNAGVGTSGRGLKTETGASTIFTVNSLAPFILTSLMDRPRRLVYVSSGLNMSGDPSLNDVERRERGSDDAFQVYCDTKLHNVLFARTIARMWPDVHATSLNPGWVPTKLGSRTAPEDIEKSGDVIAWLATDGGQSGKHYGPNLTVDSVHEVASDTSKQNHLLQLYEEISGIKLPRE